MNCINKMFKKKSKCTPKYIQKEEKKFGRVILPMYDLNGKQNETCQGPIVYDKINLYNVDLRCGLLSFYKSFDDDIENYNTLLKCYKYLKKNYGEYYNLSYLSFNKNLGIISVNFRNLQFIEISNGRHNITIQFARESIYDKYMKKIYNTIYCDIINNPLFECKFNFWLYKLSKEQFICEQKKCLKITKIYNDHYIGEQLSGHEWRSKVHLCKEIGRFNGEFSMLKRIIKIRLKSKKINDGYLNNFMDKKPDWNLD